jgi:4-hydroxybenzoate polyprenyltransferase
VNDTPQIVNLLRALRPHQWVKNLLVFVPLVAAHRVRDAGLIAAASLAFAAFSLCASSVYVTNDLLDLEHDRVHPTKRARPFASGALAPSTGWVIAPVLLVAALVVAAFVGRYFVLLLVTYWFATLAYSLHMKRVPVLDVIVLAGLYTVRLFSGSVAVDVPVSDWLATFSMFLFLSLALVKRTAELGRVRDEAGVGGRGYAAADRGQLASLGIAAGYISVLVLALYLSSEHVTTLYSHPRRLWLLCPLALYWIGRLWFLANRGAVNDDPVVFALRDKVSWLVLLGGAAVVVAAS